MSETKPEDMQDGRDHAVVVLRCPACQSNKLSRLMAAFWVPVNRSGEMVGQFSDYSSDTELTEDYVCRECDHEFDDESLESESECKECGVQNELHSCPYQEATQFNDDPKFCNCCESCTIECDGRI